MRRFQTGRLRLLGGILAVCIILTPAFADGTYTVKPGDTLSALAQRFSVSLKTLMELNRITAPDKLEVGQVLQLPKDTVAPAGTANEKPAPKTTAPVVNPSNPRELAAARAQVIAGKGEKVVEAAKGYLGTPYRWAGSTSRGIDCSGLVMRSMAVLGKNVPHNAAQLYKMGTQVHYEDLQPGDLVFFTTTRSGISHVGIWLGNNQFIHASTNRGVVVDDLKGYYARRLVGARRVN